MRPVSTVATATEMVEYPVSTAGSTLIRTLRLTDGANFAPKESANVKLEDVLRRLDDTSLKKLIDGFR